MFAGILWKDDVTGILDLTFCWTGLSAIIETRPNAFVSHDIKRVIFKPIRTERLLVFYLFKVHNSNSRIISDIKLLYKVYCKVLNSVPTPVMK